MSNGNDAIDAPATMPSGERPQPPREDATSRDVRETPQSWARLTGDVYWDTGRSPWWAWGLVFGLALFSYDLGLTALAFLVVFAIQTDTGGER